MVKKNKETRTNLFGWLAVLVASLVLQSCNQTADSGCKNAAAGPQIPVAITRLEQTMGNIQDTAAAYTFLASHPALARNYFYMGVRTRTDSAAVLRQMAAQAKDLYLDTMRADVRKYYPTLEPLQGELGGLFGRVKQAYPSFVPPRQIYTLASGFTVDILYLDSLLLLGLEHFMPDDAHYETPQMPRYVRVRMRPYTLVPGVARLLSDKFVKTTFSPEPVLVEEMVRWGKVLYFQKQMLPCLPDTVLYGYSATALAEVNTHADLIYAHFVDRGLFFSTDHLLRSKYVGERPATPEIGNKCPGRLGQWMGYQVVRKWAEEKGLTLQQVLAEPDAQKIFNEARWKPAKK